MKMLVIPNRIHENVAKLDSMTFAFCACTYNTAGKH